MRVDRVRDRGNVAHRHEADRLLERAGDSVLVERGVQRSVVMRCPDGCGDTLTINLDPRTDKAWRFYRRRNQVSLFPSVWRDTGCGSHFIVWNHAIIWCDRWASNKAVMVEDEMVLRKRVLGVLSHGWRHFWDVAQELDEVPWDVNQVCRSMAGGDGPLEEGAKSLEGHFRRI